jgi:hypothetical protein
LFERAVSKKDDEEEGAVRERERELVRFAYGLTVEEME